MIGVMLYASAALIVLTVVSNRYWRRQLAKTSDAANKLKDKADELTREVAEVAANYGSLSHDLAEIERRAGRAEQELAIAVQELETKRQSGTDRYYIFDRLEPRPGRFWEAAIRHQPDSATLRLHHRTWIGVRRYILVADSERDARERIGARFPRKSGFEVAHVVPCRLATLTVNRIAELSTFRKPGSRDEDDPPPRRATIRS